MKIAVIGAGYVGLVTGTCFSAMGNEVWCVDIDEKKIESLKKGVIPIYEPGLAEMVQQNAALGCLHFTTELSEALAVCEVCFIAVGTPMDERGAADLTSVLGAAAEIGRQMRRHTTVVDKSTVPVGAWRKVRAAVQAELDKRGSALTFDVVSNPEFLKEGSAVADCMKPDRVIVGADSERAAALMRALYKPFFMNSDNVIFMDIPSAEMTKYAANAMLACRVSFMNEVANICERVGADVNAVRRGVGSDRRIGSAFLYAGCGYGGSCFPKDMQALVHTARESGYEPELLRSIESVNRRQKMALVEKVKRRFDGDLSEKTFAVWGLTFKPDTDDMRCSPAIDIIEELTRLGARVRAYDPKASEAARDFYLGGNERVAYARSKYDALDGAESLLLVTEWKEFRSPDFGEIKMRLKTPVIFDGRNQYDAETVRRCGLDYYAMGLKPVLTEAVT